MRRLCRRSCNTLEAICFLTAYVICNALLFVSRRDSIQITTRAPPIGWNLAESLQQGVPQSANASASPPAQPAEPVAGASLSAQQQSNLAIQQAYPMGNPQPNLVEAKSKAAAPAKPPPPANPRQQEAASGGPKPARGAGKGASPSTTGDMKTILFWNSFFSAEDFRFGFGKEPFAECKVSQCRTTKDRGEADKADAFLFHGPHIADFPPKRSARQVYVYVQQEPHYYLSEQALPHYRNKFNLTMTHRPDSDMWIPVGNVLHDPKKAKPSMRMLNPRKKAGDVVMFSNLCETTGKREMYVRELSKHISVDVYGKCGTKTCKKSMHECMKEAAQNYKFYLSFEKNYCLDYVSTHLYRPLDYDIVPVVFGGADYDKVAPPHSVVKVSDYPKPEDMAAYLKSLGNNVKGYSEYLAWKTKGYTVETAHKPIMTTAFCRLCEILHDPDHQYKDYSDIKAWWVNGMCDAFFMGRFRRENNW